jgi:hypothetical protein
MCQTIKKEDPDRPVLCNDGTMGLRKRHTVVGTCDAALWDDYTWPTGGRATANGAGARIRPPGRGVGARHRAACLLPHRVQLWGAPEQCLGSHPRGNVLRGVPPLGRRRPRSFLLLRPAEQR